MVEVSEYQQKEFERRIRKSDEYLKMTKQEMNRYSKYLNKCMFIAQDDFIKKMYLKYTSKTKQKKGESFYS